MSRWLSYKTIWFDLKELEARIKILWNRKQEIIDKELSISKNIIINFSKHKFFFNNREVELSNKEYLIIEYLSINKGYAKNKTEILEKVWGESEENLELSSTTLEVHISMIRKKTLKRYNKNNKMIRLHYRIKKKEKENSFFFFGKTKKSEKYRNQ